MPFITEELWHQLPQPAGARSIALDRFPEPHDERVNAASEEQVALLQEIISSARNSRAEMKLDQKAKLPAQLGPATASVQSTVERSLETILRLANLSSLSFAKPPFDSTKGIVRSNKDFELFIAFDAAIDVPAEVARLRKEIERLTKDIASKQLKLEDQTFRSRAPEHIVNGLEATLAERRTELEKLKERLAQLEKNL
jgi:valyl-tRNA synthetase